MARQPSFPHIKTNVIDKSATAVANPVPMPLHRPMFPILASQGPLNTPIWGPFGDQQTLFGDDTFVEGSKYYNHQTLFAIEAMKSQAVYLVRVAGPGAAIAGQVIECEVTTGPVTQYERAPSGQWLRDGANNPKPLTEADGVTVITEPGVTVVFRRRALLSSENPAKLAPVTVGNKTTYPILVTKCASPGEGGNLGGFKLFWTADADQAVQDNIKAVTLRFAPVSASTGSELPIRDVYSNGFTEIAFKPKATDATTALRYDIEEVLRRDYYTTMTDGTKRSKLPYAVYAYPASVEAIAQAVLDVSEELEGTDPYQINIFAGVDADGLPYDHLRVDTATNAVLNELVVNYNVGGSDGDTSKEAYEELVAAFLTGEVNPLIGDSARFPFTHLYDSGFALDRKIDMLKIFNIRDDVKIDFSTQDVANPANTKQEDNSTGASLRAQILLRPESTLYGTPAIRASIYQQAGYLNSATAYNPLVPCSLDRLIKRCAWEGALYVKGVPKGRPNSEVTIFDPATLSWSPTGADHKQMSWDNGLNYIEFADSSTLFYADLRSVYPLETSLLSNDNLVDWLVYLKHIAREQWTIFTGRTDDPESLYDEIAKSIEKKINYAFSGRLAVTVKVYQTDLDKALGYQTTVEIAVKDNMPNRVWNVLVPVSRKDA